MNISNPLQSVDSRIASQYFQKPRCDKKSSKFFEVFTMLLDTNSDYLLLCTSRSRSTLPRTGWELSFIHIWNFSLFLSERILESGSWNTFLDENMCISNRQTVSAPFDFDDPHTYYTNQLGIRTSRQNSFIAMVVDARTRPACSYAQPRSRCQGADPTTTSPAAAAGGRARQRGAAAAVKGGVTGPARAAVRNDLERMLKCHLYLILRFRPGNADLYRVTYGPVLPSMRAWGGSRSARLRRGCR